MSEKQETCGFLEAWIGKCQNIKPCSKHMNEKCWSCGEPATSNCAETMSLVCGTPQCDRHPHGEYHKAKWKEAEDREAAKIAHDKACVNALADIPDPAAYVRACGECERALEECQGLLDAWASTDNSLSITHLFNQAKVLEGQARTALQSLQKARGK